MAEKTGVLVVDDSAFMRKILSQIIEKTDEFYVVDIARDGQDALEKIEKHGPDIQLITLDIQMPRMDGLTCLEHIMEKTPRRVVMVSSLTTEGARETLDALDAGAVDFLAKPGGAISLDFATVEQDLVKVLINASHSSLPKPVRKRSDRPSHVIAKEQSIMVQPPVAKAPAVRVPTRGSQQLVAIASSTGGPKALAQFIPHLPGDMKAALVLVQHMPTTFTRLLAERLNNNSQITVREAEDGESLRPATCLVAPGGYHMEVTTDEKVRLTKDPPIGGLRPCADITFRTVASVFGNRAMGVVLTGMGHDGTEGCKALKDKGCRILAESKETALIYGMPKSIVTNNLHDRTVPIHEMARAVVETLKH